jgi:hypothetical protein
MFTELIHRLTLPALAATIVVGVWILAWERSTAMPPGFFMPPATIDHHPDPSADRPERPTPTH